jgi:AcrR family transcriptional regulator
MHKQKQLKPRSKPSQKRSRERVDFILDTADQLVLERGYEVVTTQMISQVAGISPGVLYHYFPGKHGIFAAVARRAFERLEMKMRDLYATAAIDKPLSDLIDEIVDALVVHWRENESAIMLWQALESSRQMNPITDMLTQKSVERNSALICVYLPHTPQQEIKIKALIMKEICFSLLRQVLRLKKQDSDRVIEELKTILKNLLDA